MTTGRGMRGCGHLYHGILDASHPTFHPTIASEDVPSSPRLSHRPCQKTSMSCRNETYSDAMTTDSDNFVLAYNHQVRGSSPLAPTRSDHVS